MGKTSSSETKRLREAERKKKEKLQEERAKYYQENKEIINRKRREKRHKAKELKVAQQKVPENDTSSTDNSSKPKKYDWALYKRQQRARAKEEKKQKEEKSKTRHANKRKRSSEASGNMPGFPTRMAKKRQVDLVKSCLPKSPVKKIAVIAALIESPTTRKGLEGRGLVNSTEKVGEAEVALSAMHDARNAINATKAQRSSDSRAATQTALGFLCGDKIKAKRMKTRVSKMLNINRKRVGKAFNHRVKVLKSKRSCWTYTE